MTLAALQHNLKRRKTGMILLNLVNIFLHSAMKQI